MGDRALPEFDLAQFQRFSWSFRKVPSDLPFLTNDTVKTELQMIKEQNETHS